MDNQDTPQPLPFFFVGKTVVTNRVADYQQNKLPLLTQAIGKPETQSIWYTKDHIAKLLDEINYAGGDGLRFYFGNYEPEHPTFAGQQCILMAVTREDARSGIIRHVDVYLEDEPYFDERSVLSREFSADDDEADRGFNFGSPCPPAC